MTQSIIERLRSDNCSASDVDEAADMLEFLLSQFRSRSLHMGNMHYWHLRGGWPWTEARGPNIEAAVRRAMEKAQSEKEAE